MTDKHTIKLKPMEDLNEKIIKEKGNTECIFYADDICRNGDKTRDCINCARVEYHSLYSLNWDNQERLLEELKAKEQECEELVSKGNQLDKKCKQQSWDIGNLGYKIKNQRHEINNRLKQLDQLKAENDTLFKAIEQVNKINKKLKAENEELKGIRDRNFLHALEEQKRADKLSKTLTEIKVFVMQAKHDYNLPKYLFDTILQKISEVENG